VAGFFTTVTGTRVGHTMESEWDVVGYVNSSQYRTASVEHLYDEGEAMPSEIAEASGYALSHVSRALSQLRERRVVDLLVSEDRHRGRLYGLTDRGRGVARRLRSRMALDYSFVDASAFRHPALLETLRERVGDCLRVVAARDGRDCELVAHGVSEDAVEERCLRALLALPDLDGEDDSPCRYAVRGYEEATVMHLRTAPDRHVGAALDPTRDLALPAFAERCLTALSGSS